MKFCSQCDNMYYIGISEKDSNKMIYYCRNCGYKDEEITQEGCCVLNTQFKKSGQSFNHIINKYTKLDPTLPRINNVKCPNSQCASNDENDKTKKPEIIYLRYDDDNMKYLYICVDCDTIWKTDDAK
jgi:DNA-directed RNA polymerase subunit M/transcription elongation factor TFIIS